MNPAENSQRPSPELIFSTMSAFQRTAALQSAIDLDLFSAMGAGPVTASALAATAKASERGVRILCDFLAINGLLTKEGNRYRLTPESATFLDRRSPAYIGSCIRFVNSEEIRKGFDDLTAAVRNGGAVHDHAATPDWRAWVEFARSMAPMMAIPADLVADRFAGREADGPVKLLDIAAGHGLFGIAMARKNPRMEVVALDWPAVLEVAQENAVKADVADRYRKLPGSAFEVPFGSGYNLVLLTNFLHHFDTATNEALLRKVHAALGPGGRALALEFIPNEDRISPPMAAGFSLNMLAGTRAGDAYTFAEFQQMFRNAGFAHAELHSLPAIIEQVVVGARDEAAARSLPNARIS